MIVDLDNLAAIVDPAADELVVVTLDLTDPADARAVADAVRRAFPSNRVLVLGRGVTLDTVPLETLRELVAALEGEG